jgi:hypothetical protein
MYLAPIIFTIITTTIATTFLYCSEAWVMKDAEGQEWFKNEVRTPPL